MHGSAQPAESVSIMDLKNLKLGTIPRSAQLVIFGLVVVGLAAGFYFGILRDQLQNRDQLRGEVADLERSVAQISIVASQLERFKKELAVLETRLTELRGILPSEKETPQVLRSTQDMAATSALKITRFYPQPVIPRPFYSDWPIVIEVKGSYNALGAFFEKISRATRIINVDNVMVKGIEGSTDRDVTLTANCTVTTFVYREDVVVGAGNVPPAAQQKAGAR